MQKFKQYENGLRLTVKTLPGVLSVSTGIFIGAGSADETPENNGISHYIEHMLFKGTKKRSAFDIADTIDSIGAQINAFTTKELTCYYTKSTAEHAEKSLEVLSDIFFNSTFDDKEAEREKKVIAEEISMVEDTPDDICLDYLARAYFGKHTLGKSIIGTAENVLNFTREDVIGYMDKYYTPANTVISIAGSLSFEEADALVEKYFADSFNRPSQEITRYSLKKPRSKSLSKFKDIEQVHLAIGFESEQFNSKISNEIALVNTVLGGGMSSRLFQQVREKKGLAYSVFSYPSSYRKGGVFTIYAAVNPKSAAKACEVIAKELKLILKDKITEDEFLRGKEQLKSGLIFGQESSSSIMNAYGKFMSMTGKMLDIEDKVKAIDAMKMSDVFDILDGKMLNFDTTCGSYIGKEDSALDMLEIIKG